MSLKLKYGLKPFRVKADEREGEHARLIEFVVWARTQASAEKKARMQLELEWGERDKPEPDEPNLISFMGGQIQIDGIEVTPTTVEQIVLHASRPAPRYMIREMEITGD